MIIFQNLRRYLDFVKAVRDAVSAGPAHFDALQRRCRLRWVGKEA